jgi:hypothetical protein
MVALALVVVTLLAFLPAAELGADSGWPGAHHGHLHATAALPGDAPVLPEPLPAIPTGALIRIACPAADGPAVFVPPRV